jgi:hypothetical protein
MLKLSGISHGEDVFLIFTNGLRIIPFSEDEKIISKNLIKMYFNFANNNSTVYRNVSLEESKPDDVKHLVITSANDYHMFGNVNFGNVKFWDEIEETLADETKKNSYDEL